MIIIIIINLLFLRMFNRFIHDQSIEQWKGYGVATLIIFVNVASSLLTQHAQFLSARLSVRVRSALVNALYRKKFRVVTQMDDSKGRSKHERKREQPVSAGDFENFVASDMQRIQVFLSFQYYYTDFNYLEIQYFLRLSTVQYNKYSQILAVNSKLIIATFTSS